MPCYLPTETGELDLAFEQGPTPGDRYFGVEVKQMVTIHDVFSDLTVTDEELRGLANKLWDGNKYQAIAQVGHFVHFASSLFTKLFA